MLTERSMARKGWRPDEPDYRDRAYAFRTMLAEQKFSSVQVPASTMVKDFNKKQPVIDQGYLGSCVGCSVAVLHAHVRNVAPRSALQIYYEARRIIGETHLDEGAYIRDGIKVVSQLGAGRDVWWPYVESKFDVDPPLSVDRDALKRRVFSYHRLQGRSEFRQCLSAGFPFVIGFSVYTRFMLSRAAQSGIIPMPMSDERPQGGHAITVIGFDSNFRESDWAKRNVSAGFPASLIPQDVYICRNSWGIEWGNLGNFAIDARYLDDDWLADDAWTIRKK